MRKGIKILGKIVAFTILLAIIIPVLLTLMLGLPFVQNFVVDQATAYISHNLETEVSIDRISIKGIRKIHLEGFYVEDYEKDTLMYAGSVDAYFAQFGLRGGGLVINDVEIDNARLFLRQTPSGDMNIRQVVTRLNKNKDKNKVPSFKLEIDHGEVRNLEFRLERDTIIPYKGGVDYTDMVVRNISGQISDFRINGTDITTTIEAMSATEKSGFVVSEFSSEFALGQGKLHLENALLRTPSSDVRIDHARLDGRDWPQYKYFIDSVQLDVKSNNSLLTSHDVAFFAPTLKEWNITLEDLTTQMQGTVRDFKVDVPHVRYGESSTLNLTGSVKGLPEIENTDFNIVLKQLHAKASDVDALLDGVGAPISDTTMLMVGRAMPLNAQGDFSGNLSNFRAGVVTTSDIGAVEARVEMAILNDSLQNINTKVNTTSFDLGKLLNNSKLGEVTSEVVIDGQMAKGLVNAHISTLISRADINDYVAQDISLSGDLVHKSFDGRLVSNDKNINFVLDGMFDLNSSIPYYDFDMDINHVDLVALNVNRRDSVSTLMARVQARAGGSSLDNINGRVEVLDAIYCYNDSIIFSNKISLLGRNSENSKLVELNSDFIDATFKSRTSYKDVVNYLKHNLSRYVPTLFEPTKKPEFNNSLMNSSDNFSLITVNVKSINSVMNAISHGLEVADGANLRILFNPTSDNLSLRAASDYVERADMLATNISINATNSGDSLSFYASAEDMFLGRIMMPNLSINGSASEGKIHTSVGFNDKQNDASGRIGLTAEIDRNPLTGKERVDISILPSHFSRRNQSWSIYADGILYEPHKTVVDGFYIRNNEQNLHIDGILSADNTDSLNVAMDNFDMAPLSQFISSIGYGVEGRTSGYIKVKSALRDIELVARLGIDSATVNDVPIPDLLLQSKWDNPTKRARFMVTEQVALDTVVRGYFAPAKGEYFAQVHIDSLNMALIGPILDGIVSDTKGSTSLDATLHGQGRDLEFSGDITVRDLSTVVDFTKVEYRVPYAKLSVKNNKFSAERVPIFDTEGNEGQIDMHLSLEQLSNIAYSLKLDLKNMMALNTTPRDNDLFYGKVYGSGQVDISGDKLGVKMNIVASTDNNSSFAMPLSGKTNITNADFVKFVTPKSEQDPSNYLARRKMIYERKQRKQTQGGGAIDIGMTINVKPNTDFQLVVDPATGDIISGRGNGVLNLQINPKDNVFEMYGDYTITEGNYQFSLQNIVNKHFQIAEGSMIQWTGDPIDARLDINAIYKVKASLQPLLLGTTSSNVSYRAVPVNCIIHLGDRLSQPSVSFDVEVPDADTETQAAVSTALATPESRDKQFLFLLIFNSFMSEANSALTSDIGATATTATGLELLSNQLSSWLSMDDFNLNLRYRTNVEVGDQVDVGFSKSIVNDRLFIELEGNYLIDDKQAQGNSTLNQVWGEAYVTWLIDPGGALRLKGFTQTIDRFDENQGMQETGVGIYYKEDFNNFPDLVRRVRERFSNEQRREERKARREQRRAQADAQQNTDEEKEQNSNN